jgi:hypothetical protein
VIEWAPGANEPIEELVAAPFASATGLPRSVPSSANWTSPVGVPEPGWPAATLAVNVTGWPTTDGLADDDSAVLEAAWVTVWLMPDADVDVR